MISWHDLYTVLAALVPLYVAMILAYGSVRWWKIFSPDQCSGINRFVAIFAVPLLSFHFISTNNPYDMNFKFIAADTLQKIIILFVLTLWTNFSRNGSLEWMITIFSLSTQPNTLVMGIPLLIAMYGTYSGSLMVQIVVLQCIIWYTLLLFLFEYRGAKILIMEQFPETAGSIVEFKVDSDVVSLDGHDFLETDAQLGDDGKLHVTVRKSNVSRRSVTGLGGGGGMMMTPRPSNLSGAEIYSLSSSRNPTPRGSNFNNSDFYSMMGYTSVFPAGRHSNIGAADMYSVQSSRGPTPRPSNFEESSGIPTAQTTTTTNQLSPRFGFYPGSGGATNNSYPAPKPEFVKSSSTDVIVGGKEKKRNSGSQLGDHQQSQQLRKESQQQQQQQQQPLSTQQQQQAQAAQQGNNKLKDDKNKNNNSSSSNHDAKELHMFVWSSSASPVSEVGGLHVFGSGEFGTPDQSGRSTDGAKEIRMLVSDQSQNGESKGMHHDDYVARGDQEDFSFIGGGGGGGDQELLQSAEKESQSKLESSSTTELRPKASHLAGLGGVGGIEGGGGGGGGGEGSETGVGKQMPPASVMTRLILIMVWRKLIRNPNTYSSLIGLIWSLVAFRWHVKMPTIIDKSISILSDAGLGMAMFSLGLFMALQPKIIACGNSVASFAMVIRFLTGPAVMAVASIIIGLRGDLLRIAIVQAALPQGIVPFVFAKEYNNHPAILSTAVIFGMLIALPIDLLYYILLGL